jgi:beta-lactam-binding protein with PASTA domain
MFKRVLAYMAIGIAVIVGIALLLNFLMAFFVGGRQVTVPDIRGVSEADAVSMLQDLGLRYESIGGDYSVEYPESTVSIQDPLPGRVVKQGRKVRVTLSRGGEFQDVPYCLGKPLRTARIILERAGFVIGNVARVSVARGYPDEVLSTEPLPGAEAVKGTFVNILVNTGPRPARVILPDLKNQTYLTVKMKLERLGLFVRETSLDDEYAPLRSRIIMQEPPAGCIVSKGDTVDLITASSEGGRYSL